MQWLLRFMNTSGSLAERLISSLEAGQAAGGDSRGQQSAAILVDQVGHGDNSMEGIDRLVDLRVDDHPTPIAELRRLFELWQHQDMIEKGMTHYNKGDFAAAVDVMAKANDQFPGNANILYNLACFESLSGSAAESIVHLHQAIDLDDSFRELANKDSDFDPVRELNDFKELISTR